MKWSIPEDPHQGKLGERDQLVEEGAGCVVWSEGTEYLIALPLHAGGRWTRRPTGGRYEVYLRVAGKDSFSETTGSRGVEEIQRVGAGSRTHSWREGRRRWWSLR